MTEIQDIKQVCELLEKFYNIAITIPEIDNPIVWSLTQVIDIQTKPTTNEYIVKDWRKTHPDGRKIDCHRQTGLSRPTIDKFW